MPDYGSIKVFFFSYVVHVSSYLHSLYETILLEPQLTPKPGRLEKVAATLSINNNNN